MAICEDATKGHRRSQGVAKRAMAPLKFVENIVILFLERRFSKQNSVIRRKSNILAPLKIFRPSKFLGWLRHCPRSST